MGKFLGLISGAARIIGEEVKERPYLAPVVPLAAISAPLIVKSGYDALCRYEESLFHRRERAAILAGEVLVDNEISEVQISQVVEDV